ncbi:MAG TPA: hypothetical protein PKU78_06490 [Candidatus Dojkabacteria bacterium]|nr:hypothetical protein [Candidatus Dojkabacteria bacterium]HRO65846.1 hypothetical protein [Candidatus Dojkabacteria bacterium]HRP50893.1 hypothetical protein [Candidatus Dojkabacteria bacterium]
MDTFTISINQIHPGDFPKKSSWEYFSNFPDERFKQEFSRTPFGLALLPTVGLILMEGSHRVARLSEVGFSQIYYFMRELTNSDIKSWQQRINALHGKGIYNFGDFLSQCQDGRFYR